MDVPDDGLMQLKYVVPCSASECIVTLWNARGEGKIVFNLRDIILCNFLFGDIAVV
jgi:hypothetical protein